MTERTMIPCHLGTDHTPSRGLIGTTYDQVMIEETFCRGNIVGRQMTQFDFSGEVGRECPERHKVDERDTDQNGYRKFERLGDQSPEPTAFDLGLSEFTKNQEVGPVGQFPFSGFAGTEQSIGVQNTAPSVRASVVGNAMERACCEIAQVHVAFHAIRSRLAYLDKASQSDALSSHVGSNFPQECLALRAV